MFALSQFYFLGIWYFYDNKKIQPAYYNLSKKILLHNMIRSNYNLIFVLYINSEVLNYKKLINSSSNRDVLTIQILRLVFLALIICVIVYINDPIIL